MKYIILTISILIGLYIGAKYYVPKQEYKNDAVSQEDNSYEATLYRYNRTRALYAIKTYFGSLPAGDYAEDFYEAGRLHNIDYKVLLAICMLESTGFRNDYCSSGGVNGMGWNSNKTCFSTYKESIFYVADKLSNSPYYINKPQNKILCIYNTGYETENCIYAAKANEIIKKL